MTHPRVEQLEVPRHQRVSRRGSQLWREWCFLRVLFRHFRVRLLAMMVILVGGGLLFVTLDPQKDHSLARGMFYTWELIFGEWPQDFPESWVLRSLYFIVPVLGLTVIIEGIIDFALVMRDRRRYERNWCTVLASSYADHIVLVGFGRLGYRTFLVLRKLGEAVVVIERDPNGQFLDDLRRDGSPLLIGDARRDALLVEANIAKARSVVLATDDDLANLEIAMDAQRMCPGIRVVLRMFDQTIADKMSDGFNIQLAMSQSALSAPTFAVSAVAPSIVSSFIVGDQLVAMQRWLVRQGGALCGMTVGEVISRYGVGVIHHTRPVDAEPAPRPATTGAAPADDIAPRLFPSPDTQLLAGDGLVLQGPLHVLNDLWRHNSHIAGGNYLRGTS